MAAAMCRPPGNVARCSFPEHLLNSQYISIPFTYNFLRLLFSYEDQKEINSNYTKRARINNHLMLRESSE